MPRTCPDFRTFVRVVYGSRPLWKLLVISLIVADGTRATFRHLDATFPKYFMRTFGTPAATRNPLVRRRAADGARSRRRGHRRGRAL
mgnify:CR=1 FL=1